MNILFIDIETNGKIKDKNLPFTVLDNFPRIIQMAWMIVDSDSQEIVCQQSQLIRPDQWEIPQEPFWIEHGFSTEKSLIDGKAIQSVLLDFIYDIDSKDVGLIVAHNIQFDYSVICSELYRYKMKSERRPEKLCTMQASVNLCKIPFGRDRRPWKNKTWKYPSLSALYKFLFKKDFDNAHDALGDVLVLKDCFFEMLKRGVIQIELKTETI